MNALIEARQNLSKEWFYNAATKFAECYHLDKNANGINPNSIFNTEQLDEIKMDAKDCYDQLIRIISFGHFWNEDEWLLILTNYIQLRLLENYFNKFEVSIFDLDLDRVSAFIQGNSEDVNLKNLNSAKSLINKNWNSKLLNDLVF